MWIELCTEFRVLNQMGVYKRETRETIRDTGVRGVFIGEILFSNRWIILRRIGRISIKFGPEFMIGVIPNRVDAWKL